VFSNRYSLTVCRQHGRHSAASWSHGHSLTWLNDPCSPSMLLHLLSITDCRVVWTPVLTICLVISCSAVAHRAMLSTVCLFGMTTDTTKQAGLSLPASLSMSVQHQPNTKYKMLDSLFPMIVGGITISYTVLAGTVALVLGGPGLSEFLKSSSSSYSFSGLGQHSTFASGMRG
jgi:hypothetical protein